VYHDVRLRVWAQQPDRFFTEARLDMDGILGETTGQCKQGMDIAYDGTWGYHPLVLSLANTGEVLAPGQARSRQLLRSAKTQQGAEEPTSSFTSAPKRLRRLADRCACLG
jgi:hypothetical protein